jgi:transposase
MRGGVEVRLCPSDRERLAAVVASRNSPQKHVWRARIVLLSADGVGTMEIQRQTGKGKPTIWRWQERFMRAGGSRGCCATRRDRAGSRRSHRTWWLVWSR